MADLGRYGADVAAWRKLLATQPALDARVTIFKEAATGVAEMVSRGLDKSAAGDELHDMATAYGLVAAYGEDEVQTLINDGFREGYRPAGWLDDDNTVLPFEKPNGVNGHHTKVALVAVVVVANPYLLPDPKSIPPREWLAFRHYMRGVVTSTVAPGGFGKTSLAIYEGLEMVKLGLGVWYVSAEDDHNELDRRIAAYVERHGITPAELTGKYFVDDKLSFPFKIAHSGRAGVVFDDAKLAAFEAEIARRHIDVVMFDPFVSFHYLPENDTASMDALVKRLGDICARQRCCIELPHHVRKRTFGQAEITVDDARGAGAIVNAVRSCRVLNVMSTIEAEQAEIDKEQRLFYLRIDTGKSNMAPPEKARWLHLKSVEIANGDHVGCIEPWEFPKVFKKLSVADVDWIVKVVKEKPYRADSQSPEWLGHVVAKRFGRSSIERGDIRWLNAVLTTWVHNNVIDKEKRRDKDRKERTYFVPHKLGEATARPPVDEVAAAVFQAIDPED